MPVSKLILLEVFRVINFVRVPAVKSILVAYKVASYPVGKPGIYLLVLLFFSRVASVNSFNCYCVLNIVITNSVILLFKCLICLDSCF